MRSGSLKEKEEEFTPMLEDDAEDEGSEWEDEQFDKDGEPIHNKKGHGDDEDEADGYSVFDDWREREEYA